MAKYMKRVGISPYLHISPSIEKSICEIKILIKAIKNGMENV